MAPGAAPGGPGGPGDGVRTFVRLRPPSESTDIKLFDFLPSRPGVITIKDPLSSGRCEHSYEFTGVCGVDFDQEQVFQMVASPILDGALAGRNGCVLAYGQTGSGKTFSVFGEGAGERRGMLQRAAERIFAQAKGVGASVSFLEVYNDQVRDLGAEAPPAAGAARGRAGGGPAAGARAGAGLELHEAADGRVFVRGLERLAMPDPAALRRILERGLRRRATAATAANATSSRSHTVLAFHLPRAGPAGPAARTEEGAAGEEDAATLSFVDLAGSERVAKSHAEGARFQEAVAINSSLTCLGKVILALASSPEAGRHVPYRDSKLTRVLSPSLSGGARVALLATLHPRVEDYEESLCTLSFADRCKNVAHQPRVNYISGKKGAQSRIRELQAQIDRLKEALQQHRFAQGLSGDPLSVAESAVGGLIEGVPIDFSSEDAASWARDGRWFAAAGGPAGAVPGLQQELQREAASQARAAQRMEALGEERKQMKDAASRRAEELAELGRRREALEEEFEKAQAEVASARQALADSHEKELSDMRERLQRQRLSIDGILLQIHAHTKATSETAGRLGREVIESRCELQKQGVQSVNNLKKLQAEELSDLHAQWALRLEQASDRNNKLHDALVNQQESDARCLAECREEYRVVAEMAIKLAGVVANAEDGHFPVLRHDGLKEVVLPVDALPPLPSQEAFPNLCVAVAEADEGTDAAARPRAAPADPAGARGLDVHGGCSATPGAAARAAAVCEAGDPEAAAALVAGLGADELRALCLELRCRALAVFSLGDELDALRREAVAGLEDEATLRHVQRLEVCRDAARAELAGAVARGWRVRAELEAARGQGRAGPSRLGDRPWSAATGTTRTGSRSTSRPTTAGPSRPTTAGHSRPATAGPSRPPTGRNL